MRLRRKDYSKMNPGETNEDCPGVNEEEWKEICGNVGLNIVDDEAALTRLLKKARKRTKSFLTRAGKRAVANWTTEDKTFYLSRAGKRGNFYLSRAGKKRGNFYLTRAGKRDLTRQVTASPRRAPRTDRSYLTRAGKRGNFYLTRAGKRSGLLWSEKRKDKSYLTRAGKRSAFYLRPLRQVEIV